MASCISLLKEKAVEALQLKDVDFNEIRLCRATTDGNAAQPFSDEEHSLRDAGIYDGQSVVLEKGQPPASLVPLRFQIVESDEKIKTDANDQIITFHFAIEKWIPTNHSVTRSVAWCSGNR